MGDGSETTNKINRDTINGDTKTWKIAQILVKYQNPYKYKTGKYYKLIPCPLRLRASALFLLLD